MFEGVNSGGPVFLSHAGEDSQAARQFAEILRRNGLEVWFDQDNLQPGDPWMETLEKVIVRASAMLVYVGARGIQGWVDREVRLGLVENTRNRHAFRLIPVLGEGADPAKLPPFLEQQQCADLRDRHRAPEQIRRLVEVLRDSSPARPTIPAGYWTEHCPFRSLREFTADDAWLFFGRDGDVAELLARLGRAPTLAVVGNSGSGKSSLIHAGLIPALRRGRFRPGGEWVDSWRIAVFRPSADPFGYLAEVLPGQLAPELNETERAQFIEHCKNTLPTSGQALPTAIAALLNPSLPISKSTRILLVADQFEELFTLVQDAAVRSRYIESLLAAARLDGAVPIHLVLTLRADFYGHCLDHPALSASLDTNIYNVPTMGQPQLRESIENRLALAAVRAESGLIDTVLAEAGAEPGNLALLEHALAQMWEKSGGAGGALTNDSYVEIGRLRGSIGKHADEVYSGLSESDRPLARRIFLELVQLGEGAQDTRRRVTKQSLLHLGAAGRMEWLIAHLASKRLLATSGGGEGAPAETFVEVSHEALIREWPTLRDWLKDSRGDLRLARSLLQAAEEWRRLNRDSSGLLNGLRLAQARDWLARRPEAPPLVVEFFEASQDAEQEAARQESQARDREIVRQKELLDLAEARQSAEEAAAEEARRSAARTRRFAYVLSILLVFTLGGALYAWLQQLTAQSQSRAAQAEQMMAKDQHAALNLAFRGWSARRTEEAHLAVARAFPQLQTTLADGQSGVGYGEFSRDGRRLLTISSDGARVWSLVNGKMLVRVDDLSHDSVAAMSPDGQRAVTVSSYQIASLWNVTTGEQVAVLQGHVGGIYHAAFSPDSQRIVTSGNDGTARIWYAVSGQQANVLSGHKAAVNYADFSLDGRRIVTASDDKTARVWSTTDGQEVISLAGHERGVTYAELSPDGLSVLTASEDNTARVWNLSDGRLVARFDYKFNRYKRESSHARFSPDGKRIVISNDKAAQVRSAATGRLQASLAGHEAAVFGAAFSPDGQSIVTASDDKTARLWNAADGQLLAIMGGHEGPVYDASFAPDGHHVVTTSVGGKARVWGVANGQLLVSLVGHKDVIRQVAFSPDGQWVVTASKDGTARVWSPASGRLVAVLKFQQGDVRHAAFSPDGKRVLAAGSDEAGNGKAGVWKTTTGGLLAELAGAGLPVEYAEFAPDGKKIVTVSGSEALLWNATNYQRRVMLGDGSYDDYQATFSPDSSRIVTAGADTMARVWDATTGRQSFSLDGQQRVLVHAEFSADGQRIVTAGHLAQVWNAADGKPLLTLGEGPFDYASFSRDGRLVVTASSRAVQVWNAVTGLLLAAMEGNGYPRVAVGLSPNGHYVATGLNNTVRVWSTDTGQLLTTLEGHTRPVTHTEFSPDGQHIVTASDDGTARVYRLITLSELAKILGN